MNRIGKTEVKRPLRLAALNRTAVVIRNNFGAIGESVFSSVSSVLSELLTDALVGSVSHKNESLDGIKLMLPAQCLLALSSFTKCSFNTICQRYMFLI